MTDEVTAGDERANKAVAPANGADGWTPEALLRVHHVSQVRVSPDGSRVVFAVDEAVMTEEKSEFVLQLYLANTDGTDVRQITFGETSATNPRWSPDGRWLAFLAKRGEKDKAKANLYRLPVAGGEAEPLTDLKSDIGDYRWSPDGSQIAFTMSDPPTEDEERRQKTKEDWRWTEEDVKYARLYVIDAEKAANGKREPRKLTTADIHVPQALGSFGGFDWSPDGRTIVFTHVAAPKFDHWTTAMLSIVEVATGEVRSRVTGGAPAASFFSPDGKTIAFIRSGDPPCWAFDYAIHLIDAADGEPRALPATFEAWPNLLGWSADGARLYFTETQGTLVRLASIDVRTGEIVEISRGGDGWLHTEFNLNQTRTHLGFPMQSLDRPVEAFVSRADDFVPVPVSRANADAPTFALGRTEVIRWTSADGREIEGLLTYPVGYADGERVPLLLEIHGGPAGVFLQGYVARPYLYPLAAFAARGFAILRANPRGSSGYGKEFRFANRRDWGGGDFQDLMAGVDAVIARGIADPERLGVMGWSYGGFMTSWVITHTRRFKAASVGAAVTNLCSFTGTADIPGFVPDYFGGDPWDSPEMAALFQAHSPMTHTGGVTTPTLIQHGEADVRVPISQGYELFNALKRQNVETRMLVLPRQPHGPTEPKMVLKTMQTNLEWFERLL